jgi:mRNA (guanine-N7-)-methyltransferase
MLQKFSHVLDLCGGKGGDLTKYTHFPFISHVTLADISDESINESIEKYKKLNRPSFTFNTIVLDAWKPNEFFSSLSYDIVICHFALHYACVNEATLEQTFLNIQQCLKPGGLFIFTVPNSQEIQKFKNNNICQIEFKKATVTFENFTPYSFSLVDSVQNCVEYLVPSYDFMKLLGEKHDLKLLESQSFKNYSVSCVKNNMNLAQKMKVIDYSHISLLTKEEENVSNLYDFYVFQKKKIELKPN